MSGKSLSPLGFGCHEWFRRDYGGCRGGCGIITEGVVGFATVTGEVVSRWGWMVEEAGGASAMWWLPWK